MDTCVRDCGVMARDGGNGNGPGVDDLGLNDFDEGKRSRSPAAGTTLMTTLALTV